MRILKEGHEQAAVSLAPIETDMTLEEFLQSDLEGYEYVKGKLIPMPPPTMEHGEICMSLSLLLGVHIRAKISWGVCIQRIQTLNWGSDWSNQMSHLFRASGYLKTDAKAPRYHQIWRLKSSHRQTFSIVLLKRHSPIWTLAPVLSGSLNPWQKP